MTVTDEPKEAPELLDPAIQHMIEDYPEFPEFLLVNGRTEEERRAEWAGLPVTVQGSNQSAADIAERGRSVAAAMAEEQRVHNARGLARLKEKHHGERYDRKTRKWVSVGEGVEENRQPDRDVLQELHGPREGAHEDGS